MDAIIIGIVVAVFVGLIAGAASNKNKTSSSEKKVSFDSLKKQSRRIDQTHKETSRVVHPTTRFFSVKGLKYRDQDAINEAQYLDDGDTLILVPEPNNSVDPYAVRVITLNGTHIGYVPASDSYFVTQNIDYIEYCRVTNVSSHEIPFIDAVLKISPNRRKQPEFIKKELQVTPKDEMRDLALGRSSEYDYTTCITIVEGTYELQKDILAKAKALQQGDKLILKKPEPMEYYPNRLDLYTNEGYFIGFIYGYTAQNIYSEFDKIHLVSVESPMDAHDHGKLGIRIYFTKGTDLSKSNPGISINIVTEFKGPYPQLGYVDQIKRTDTEKALGIALPIAEKENGIDAKFLCCQCYRLQKDYESERMMILKILDYIVNLKPGDVSPSDYFLIKNRLPEITKRLNTVDSRLASKTKKNHNNSL